MEIETAKITRAAQAQSLAELLDVSSAGPLAWARMHEASLPTSLQVTVDGGFQALTLGTRSRERGHIEGAADALSDDAPGLFAKSLAQEASRVVQLATFARAGKEAAVAFGGAWSMADVEAAWGAAGLDVGSLGQIVRVHRAVSGGVFDVVELGATTWTLQFEVAVAAERKHDAADALVSCAEVLGVTALQRGLLRGMLDTWLPRPMNYLTLRLRFDREGLVPGLGVGFHDVPSEFAVVGLQVGRPHPRGGVLYGAMEGVLMPDRPVAKRVFFELGPEEPVRVVATLESTGVPTDV